MPKKILIVCMFDSLHSARWISHFKEKNIDITIFPSRKFRKAHQDIISLLGKKSKINSVGIYNYRILRFSAYIDFLLDKIFKIILKKSYRKILLECVVREGNFDFVHALESQSAGYLCSEVLRNHPSIPLVLNCWGSDIYFYKNEASHQPQLSFLLNRVNYFSADCKRDYGLAAQFGFRGIELPIVPSIDPIRIPIKYENMTEFEKRNLILIKGYGAQFGDLPAILPDLENILINDNGIRFMFYSLDEEYFNTVKKLISKYPGQISYITNNKPVSNSEMQVLFSKALIHIGYSKSDGLPASVLESMKWGVYPIQTNTSCLQELVLDGAKASLIPLIGHHLKREIEMILNDLPTYKDFVKNNIEFVNQNYSISSVEKCIESFYN
jgi:glycosyltransferase involved in cell wall biosynthesis